MADLPQDLPHAPHRTPGPSRSDDCYCGRPISDPLHDPGRRI